MDIDPKFIDVLQQNSIAILHLMTITFMRPLGLLFGFIGMIWAIGGAASLIRTGVAFALALPIMYYEGTNLLQLISESSYLVLFAMFIKEFALGLGIGLIASIPFWIVQFGGSILDSYRGENNSGAQDPAGGEMSTLSHYHMVVALLIFTSLGGITFMFGEFYKTYQLWPITASVPALQEGASGSILELLNYLTLQAIVIAAPLLLLMIAIDFMALVSGKIAKGFNAMDISFGLKNMLTMLLLPVFAFVLVNTLQDKHFKNMDIRGSLKQVLK